MKEVAAKLDGVRAAVNRDIVVQFKIAIDPARETGRVAHRGERVAQRNLRIAEVAWICRGALQPVLAGKIVTRVLIALPARYAQPAEPNLVKHVRREGVDLAPEHIHGVRV